MKWVVLILVAVVQALRPVRDFREIKSYSSLPKKIAANVLEAAVVSSTSQSVPTLELLDTVHWVSTDDTNSIYYLNVSVNNTDFPLLLDTGSAITWIYNQSCLSDVCERVERFAFDYVSDDTFSLSYSGDVVLGDLVDAGENGLDVAVENLHLAHFEFGVAGSSPLIFDDYNVSGIVGLPLTSLGKKHLIAQLVSEDAFDSKVFGLQLLSEKQSVDTGNLTGTFGGVLVLGDDAVSTSSKFAKKVYYTDVIDNDNSYWLINITSVHTHNDSASLEVTDSRRAIIDTGTTGLALPKDDADALHSYLFGNNMITDDSGNYAFPCDDTDFTVTLEVGTHQFNLSSEDFMASEYLGSLSGYCASKIQGIESDYWILGAAFLSQFYTIFDMEQLRIGFGDTHVETYAVRSTTSTKTSSTTSSKTSTTTSKTSTKVATATSSSFSRNSTTSTVDSGASRVGISLLGLLL